ncbi:Serine/arginine repetitive matrix protein 1 [Apophysomyces sp. BC1034]|nr:Serine/arginine repetitive matrix protein 1 [Apophysomyces sp. BC1034]
MGDAGFFKVDIKKVNLDVIKPWISNRITQLLGFEDEVVIDFTFGLLEEENPDPKMMQINLTGFLEKNTQSFILELWKLLLSAQDAVGGIPKAFLEQKKEELRQKKEHEALLKARQNAVMEAIRKRKELELIEQRENEAKDSGRKSRFIAKSRSRSRSRSRSPPRQRSRERKRFVSHQEVLVEVEAGIDLLMTIHVQRAVREVGHRQLADTDHAHRTADLTDMIATVMTMLLIIATAVREMITVAAEETGTVATDDVIGRDRVSEREEVEVEVYGDTVGARVRGREDSVEVQVDHAAMNGGDSHRTAM